jgi:hypothetical protein
MKTSKNTVGVNKRYTAKFKERAVIVLKAYRKAGIKAASKVAAKDLGIANFATLTLWERQGF